MEIPGYGYFLPGDEFIEKNSKKDQILFGKVIRSEKNDEILEIMWSRMRKTCFNDRFSYKNKDVVEDMESLQRGLSGGQVKILDRKFKQGDLVRIGGKVGEVVDISYLCVAIVQEVGRANPKVILNLPDRQLRPIAKFAKGERVVLNGWLGIVQDLNWNAHLVSNERERCTLMFKNGIWASNSFGTAKPYVMHRGQCIVFTKDYTNELKWAEKKSHRYLWFIVSYVTLESISVDWIGKIPRTPEIPKPDSVISSETLNSVVQLDIQSNPVRLFTGFYRYQKDQFEREILVVDKNNWLTLFVREIFSKNRRLQNTKVIRVLTGIDPERSRSSSKPEKISKKRSKSNSKHKNKTKTDVGKGDCNIEFQVHTDDIPGNSVVDVIFTQQVVEVNWENNQLHQILSRHLERVEPLPRPTNLFRSFVQSKTGKFCGVAHWRDQVRAITRVQWFRLDHVTKDLLLDGDIKEESCYDIYPHPEYSSIHIGSLVCRSESCSQPNFSYGIVLGIHRNGRVSCSRGEGRKKALLWPSDIETVTHLFYFPSWSQLYRTPARHSKYKIPLAKVVQIARRDTIPPTQEESYRDRANQSQTVTIGGNNFPVFATIPSVKAITESH